MRLGFHYHVPAMEKEDSLFMPGYFGRFIDGLADQCKQFICFMHSPLPEEISILDYKIKSQNVKLVNIGPHGSIPKRMLAAPHIIRQIKQYRNDLDAMLIRGPSPLLPAVAVACGNLPVALLIVGDYLAGVDYLPQPRWRKEAIRAWSWWNTQGQLRAAKRSLTFVNSHVLYQQLNGKVPNLIETRTTTLTEKDFFLRENTCQNKPIRLLYTGRMARAKGILDILEAVNWLVNQGEDIVFDLVGMIEKGDPVLDELSMKAREYGISDRVKFHGYRPVGPELFRFYEQSDIYVIASQSSFEGFPRTIWEAMAHCLPVIATNVGSIPDFLINNKEAVIIPSKDVRAMVDAISKLLNNSSFRRNIISNGYKLSLGNQINKRSQEMIQALQLWISREDTHGNKKIL